VLTLGAFRGWDARRVNHCPISAGNRFTKAPVEFAGGGLGRMLATAVHPPEDSVMIDHLAIQCADVTVSAAFYDAVLAPVGGLRAMDFGDVIGYGVPPMPEFWIGPLTTGDGFRESHIAFTAPDRAAVRAFFQAAVEAGAEVLHEPRLWPEYHPSYYGAFVRDPDGNNVEAVCHAEE
jgi:catechol 2,3-dioxygenase-like lactoylglutathione lyase family enzyme